jgi:hypothetical protein
MIGRIEAIVEGVQQDSGSDDPSYGKAKEAGLVNEASPVTKEVTE